MTLASALVLLLQSPWSMCVGWTLVHFLWQGAILAVITAVGLHTLRDRTAQCRYALLLTIGAILTAAPATTFLSLGCAINSEKSSENFSATRSERRNLPSNLATGAMAPATADATRAKAVPNENTALVSIIPQLMPWIVASWIFGVCLSTGRLLQGLYYVRQLKTVSVFPVTDQWQHRTNVLAQRLGMKCAVRVLSSAIARVPMAVGWVRPVILFPTSLLTSLSPYEIEALLLHELAHLRRWDNLVNLIQTLVETLLFYHPAVWWISSLIRQQREACCDDIAVKLVGDCVVYSRALLSAAEHSTGRPNAFVLAASDRELVWRIRRLFELDLRANPRTAEPNIQTKNTGACLGLDVAPANPAFEPVRLDAMKAIRRPSNQGSISLVLMLLFSIVFLGGIPVLASRSVVFSVATDPQNADELESAKPTQKPIPRSVHVSVTNATVHIGFKPDSAGIVVGLKTYRLSDLLLNEKARFKLKLTGAQKAEIANIITEIRAAKADTVRQFGNLASRAHELQILNQQLDSIESSQVELLLAVLDLNQSALAKNILLQLNGELSFAYAMTAQDFKITDDQLTQMRTIVQDVVKSQSAALRAAATKLTDQQKHNIREIQSEIARRKRERRAAGLPPNRPDEDADLHQAIAKNFPARTSEQTQKRRQTIDARREIICDRIRGVLTAEQQQRLDVTTGPKADLDELEAIQKAFPVGPFSPQKA